MEDAETLKPQVLMNKANDLLKSKNLDGAIAAYNDLLALNPANGTAQLRLGMAYAQKGDTANAETAYLAAAANGQEKAANKQLANMYLKEAQAALKGQKYADAYDAAMKEIKKDRASYRIPRRY